MIRIVFGSTISTTLFNTESLQEFEQESLQVFNLALQSF